MVCVLDGNITGLDWTVCVRCAPCVYKGVVSIVDNVFGANFGESFG